MAYLVGTVLLGVGLLLLLRAPELAGDLGQRIQNSANTWRVVAATLVLLGTVRLIQGHWNGLAYLAVGPLLFARAPVMALPKVSSSQSPALFVVGGLLATLVGMSLLLGWITMV